MYEAVNILNCNEWLLYNYTCFLAFKMNFLVARTPCYYGQQVTWQNCVIGDGVLQTNMYQTVTCFKPHAIDNAIKWRHTIRNRDTILKKKFNRLNLNLLLMCRMFKTFSPKKLVGTDKICECGVPSVSTHREVFVAVVNENLWVLRQWNCELDRKLC